MPDNFPEWMRCDRCRWWQNIAAEMHEKYPTDWTGLERKYQGEGGFKPTQVCRAHPIKVERLPGDICSEFVRGRDENGEPL